MTQQPCKSRLVASWWARRETSSVDSNYRYPTPRPLGWPVGLHNAIYMLQVLIALHGCDRSASFAAGHEFVDTSTREGRSLDIIAGCSSKLTRETLTRPSRFGAFAPKVYFHSIDLPSIRIFEQKRITTVFELSSECIWIYYYYVDRWNDKWINMIVFVIEYSWNFCREI